MSCIVLQLGQCGNQVGQRVFDTLIEDNLAHSNQPNKISLVDRSSLADYIAISLERFFIQHDSKSNQQEKLTARALAIDTELKVIEQLMNDKSQSSRHWHYEKKCVHEGRLGSGNNWACGYRNGSLAEESILNALRWQLEHADRVDTILPILSLAGGTGSGLGAYIVECVRDELPRSFLLTTIVVPYTSGEVVVQNYNSLLTLSHLYHSTDALLVFENDILQQYAKKLVSHSGLDRPTNIHDMNIILTRQLCSFLQPAMQPSKSTCELNYLLESLLPHSFHKLLTLRCVPQLSDQAMDFSTYKWSSLVKNLAQMYINNSYLDEGLNWSLKPYQTRTKSIANIFLARSSDTEDIHQELTQYFRHESFYSKFLPPSQFFELFGYRQKSYLNYEKYLSFVSNCQTPVSSLDRILNKSWQLYGQKAYLHHYLKYDIDEQAFLNAFVQIEQVIKSYNQL